MRVVIALLCSAVLVGCSSSDGNIPTSPASSSLVLSLSSNDAMASTGDMRSVTATATDNNQPALSSATWNSSAPAVATVSGTGASASITAVDDGTATITATSGSLQGAVTVTVHRKVASIVFAHGSSTLTFGTSTQLTANALDARHNAIAGVTGFTYASSNPTTVIVSPSGLATALFQFPQVLDAVVTATLTRDGITTTGSTTIIASSPPHFDYAALMLSDYVKPNPTVSIAAGLSYFTIEGDRISYIITWSAFTGPATAAHIHLGSAGDVSDVLVTLPAGAQASSHGSLIGSFSAADIRPQEGQPAIPLDMLITLMRTGHAYVDVHSTTNVGGEIRGQVIGPF